MAAQHAMLHIVLAVEYFASWLLIPLIMTCEKIFQFSALAKRELEHSRQGHEACRRKSLSASHLATGKGCGAKGKALGGP